MSKKIKKIVGTVAPIAAGFIPGVGPALGAAIGAGGGLLAGGGLKGALLGGATGGLAAGGANSLVSGLNKTAGLNLGTTVQQGLSKGLTGAALGASAGGLKGALLGGALAGIGGYASAGGTIPGLGSIGGELGAGGMGPATPGTGVLGTISRGTSALGNLTAGGTNTTSGGGTSSYSSISPIVSGALDYMAQDDAADQLEKRQREALGYITPILNETFDASNLEETPGFQFNLSQGQKALDRVASARGNYFSGQSLTDAADFATGLAQDTYQDVYNNWLNDRNQRLSAAAQAAGLTQGIGETQATSALNKGQTLAQSTSALLGSLGRGNVYDARTGTFYNPAANGNSIDVNAILKQLGYA